MTIRSRFSATGERPNAFPHVAKRANGPRLSTLQEDQAGEHTGGRHRGR